MHRLLTSHDQNEGWDMENLSQSYTYQSCFINLCIWQYYQVDPTTGETEDDGVEDEYQLEGLEVAAANYMLKVGSPISKMHGKAWMMKMNTSQRTWRLQQLITC